VPMARISILAEREEKV